MSYCFISAAFPLSTHVKCLQAFKMSRVFLYVADSQHYVFFITLKP